MVTKGEFRRKQKEKKAVERQDKSLCVKIKNRIETTLIESLVLPLHPGIEQVYFPRQKKPKFFFFVLCKSPAFKEEVRKKIKAFKNDDVGFLIPKDVYLLEPKPKKEKKRSIDKKIIVLEKMPRSLKTEAIVDRYPKAVKINRFNARRCYLHFENVEDAMEAFEQLTADPIEGALLKPKFQLTTVQSSDSDADDMVNDNDSDENSDSDDN